MQLSVVISPLMDTLTSTTARDPLAGSTLFWRSLVFSALGIACGALLFPSQASIIAVVLLAFSEARPVEQLLDRNRDEIWGKVITPSQANAKLALSLFTIFMGVFTTYLAAVQLAPDSRVEEIFHPQIGDFMAGSVEEIAFGTFGEILAHNSVVFAGCFAFALFYRHAGMLLVLAWNASAWGVVFSYLALVVDVPDFSSRILYIMKTLPCILPHLGLEAMAYVIVAMAGVFANRALAKYSITSDPFLQVARAILQLLFVAYSTLALASAVEAYAAPALIDVIFR